MQADILDGVATWLGTVMSVDVHYPELPRSAVEAKPRSKCLVITPAGSDDSAGDRSYVAVSRPRARLTCIGENAYQAMKVYREAAPHLKSLRAQSIQCDEVFVRISNAVLDDGPNVVPDSDVGDQVVISTWGVIGSEVGLEL